jgi:uncharacterized radical SAM protein YgiQ
MGSPAESVGDPKNYEKAEVKRGNMDIADDQTKTFLPMSRYEMQKRGWDVCDVILLTGDAYIDHPSYGVAVVARLLESEGLRVGIIAQPNPNRAVDFTQLGKPRLFFGVTSGCADSMINNYSPTKRPRKFDNYSAGRLPGKRPDHAVVAYSKILKKNFPEVPVVLGGIEASLRRLAHYDYFDDEVNQSILLESEADILIYGQAEKALRELVSAFRSGEGIAISRKINGIAWKADIRENLNTLLHGHFIELPSFETVYQDKLAFFKMAKSDLLNFDPFSAKLMVQQYPDHYLIINRPQFPLTSEELDEIHNLPYVRTPHPKYKKQGAIPAFETVKFSLMTHRGCFAGCSFCPIYAHQGRFVSSRSEQNILDEAKKVSGFRYFRNVISNVGGPVGNLYMATCSRFENGKESADSCSRISCYYPDKCKHLKVDLAPYIELLRGILDLDGVQQAFIASNFRYDLLDGDARGQEFLELILEHFTGDQLKIAPVHVSDSVTRRVRKYSYDTTKRFFERYQATVDKMGLNGIEVVPYFMASHPGSTIEDALEVALFMEERGIRSSQIQDFVPMPGTASACMYYTGLDPMNDEQMYRPLSHRERKLQRALLQYFKPENGRFVYEALIEAGRTDLIGQGSGCLLPEIPDDTACFQRDDE